MLYEGEHAGGFGKTFRLADGRALDLGAAVERARAASMDDASTDDGKFDLETHNAGVAGAPPLAPASTGPAPSASAGAHASPAALSPSRRRFPFIGGRGRRAREADLEAQILAEASGNTFHADQRAGAAADGAGGEAIEMTETGGAGAAETKADQEGMRVLITVAGLQGEGAW